MRRVGWVIAVLAFALAAWTAWRLWPSDARRISDTLGRLAADASVPGPEAELERLARVARLSAYLTPDAVLELGENAPTIEGRDAILGLAARARGFEGTAQVRFVDVGVTIDEGGTTARATMTATVTTRDRRSGDPVVDAREVETDWVKVEGTWRIRRATAVSTLR